MTEPIWKPEYGIYVCTCGSAFIPTHKGEKPECSCFCGKGEYMFFERSVKEQENGASE